ncbi:AsmA-like C-terminal region-containing protein, partial [Paraburkholderia sp. BR14261]
MSQPAQNMPSIDLVVNQLIVRDRDLGRLQVNAHNFDDNGVPVWQLDQLDISNPDAHLTATENWRAVGDTAASEDSAAAGMYTARRTALDFHLDIKDAGALLQRAGRPHVLKNGSGTLAGNLEWQGGPTRIDFPSLNGNLTLDLRHGQILKVDPGVARLLGVLSLQSLARFLTTDFRDVIGEG